MPAPAQVSETIRIGYVPLNDAAPLIAASEHGDFDRQGLHVRLSREAGWATIRDKLISGELDAAQAPAPMLWALQLGIGCVRCDVLTAFVLGRNGNALTLSRALSADALRGDGLRQIAADRRASQPLTFGVVFNFSSHHLLLREWLRSHGLSADRDYRIVTVPPAQMCRNLAAGNIDGYAAGEPWNSLAVAEKVGWCPVWSSAVQPGQIEKVLVVTRRFAESRATEHTCLLRALGAAAAWCDQPGHRSDLVRLLAKPEFLHLPEAVVAPALVGPFDTGVTTESVPEFHIFWRGDSSRPTAAAAAALESSLIRAGLLAGASTVPTTSFRPDLWAAA